MITKGVKGTGTNAAGLVTITATFSAPTTGGGIILVGIVSRSSTINVTGITDNAGVPATYSQIGPTKNGVTNSRTFLYGTPINGSKAGTTTVTATMSIVEGNTLIMVMEWFGVVGYGPIAHGGGNSANPVAAGINLQDNNNYMFTMFGHRVITLPTQDVGVIDQTIASNGSAGQEVVGAMVSNTQVGLGSIICSTIRPAATWMYIATELRSSLQKSAVF